MSSEMANGKEIRETLALGIAPKLRFPEFRGTKAWLVEPFGSIYMFKRTNSLSRDQLTYEDGHIKNIHYGDIHTRFSTLFDLSREVVPFIGNLISIENFPSDCFCREGDIVFADASEDTEGIGKCIEIARLDNQELLSGMHTLLARQKSNRLINGFGGHLFQSGGIRRQVVREAQGAKVLGISAKALGRVLVCYPKDRQEQGKIVECLSSLDELIAAEGQKLDALKAHKKGLMQQLFPAVGETTPRLRFPDFQDAPEWADEKLGKYVDIYSGSSPSALMVSSGGTYPFVKVEDLNNCGKYLLTAREFVDDADGIVPKESILFPKRGAAIELNKIRITASEIQIDTNLMAIRPRRGLSAEFLFYYLSNIGLAHIADTSTIPQINNKHILPFPIRVPLPDEQQRIAQCVKSLDARIAAEFERLATLRNHKSGLMQQLFPSLDEVQA